MLLSPKLVVALAGRRIDSPGANPARFPSENVERVTHRIEALLTEKNAGTLICSAACGADLIALEAARRLGCRFRVVLPFTPEQFRATSVVDRPGDWGERYDRIIDEVERLGELVVLSFKPEDPMAYKKTNLSLLDESVAMARNSNSQPLAVVVWEGSARRTDDATWHFLRRAQEIHLACAEIQTLG